LSQDADKNHNGLATVSTLQSSFFANPMSLNQSYVILSNFILSNLFAWDMPAAAQSVFISVHIV